MQSEQRAAGAHGAVGVGPGSGAAHFIGNQVGVSLQTLRQAIVHQLVEGEWALKRRYLLGFFPTGDHGG